MDTLRRMARIIISVTEQQTLNRTHITPIASNNAVVKLFWVLAVLKPIFSLSGNTYKKSLKQHILIGVLPSNEENQEP